MGRANKRDANMQNLQVSLRIGLAPSWCFNVIAFVIECYGQSLALI
jgi:hypothetical protein